MAQHFLNSGSKPVVEIETRSWHKKVYGTSLCQGNQNPCLSASGTPDAITRGAGLCMTRHTRRDDRTRGGGAITSLRGGHSLHGCITMPRNPAKTSTACTRGSAPRGRFAPSRAFSAVDTMVPYTHSSTRPSWKGSSSGLTLRGWPSSPSSRSCSSFLFHNCNSQVSAAFEYLHWRALAGAMPDVRMLRLA